MADLSVNIKDLKLKVPDAVITGFFSFKSFIFTLKSAIIFLIQIIFYYNFRA